MAEPSGTPGPDEARRGALYGFAAYLAWGAFPLYFHALIPATALEILAHRIVWTFVLCLAILMVRRDLAWLRPLARRRRLVAGISVAAVLVAINWVVYVEAVVSGNVTEAALGYFLNPIVTVALGVFVLGEKLRPLQWVAVGVGLLAGVYLSVAGGRVPWIALILAFSFAGYGLAKKRLGETLPALHSLTAETVVLSPIALGVIVWLGVTGQQTFTQGPPLHPALIILGGAITAGPLILFAAAARRVPLVTIGLLQFITPVLQLLCGVLLLGEHMSTERWIGFGIVWLALLLLSVDSLAARPRSPAEVAHLR
ncbi:EamA family transporter RarD [Lapillicoccus sp.]|uniref:EamA family transporter RarD n=1 Tax=Lapillicoccus sp. TaxID=1909287 RepID=UPI0025E379D8|nr:EamA family transporter RarD [Lapillicoccus sp.]